MLGHLGNACCARLSNACWARLSNDCCARLSNQCCTRLSTHCWARIRSCCCCRQSLQINFIVIVYCHCLHKWHFILDILPHPLCFMQYCFAGALVLSKLEMLDWHNIFTPPPLDNFDTFRQISESFYCLNYQIIA